MNTTGWSLAHVERYWDAVADRYLALFRDELDGKPFDRAALDAFARRIGPGGQVCDAGCGPCGHVARYLGDRGLDVIGIDLSPRCVALARGVEPSVRFERMDMAALSFADRSLDGIVAYYSIHYQPLATLPAVLVEFRRVLRPGGALLVVAKAGDGEGWIDDPMGSGQQVWWAATGAAALVDVIRTAGFLVSSVNARGPLTDEIAVERIYVTATRPALVDIER